MAEIQQLDAQNAWHVVQPDPEEEKRQHVLHALSSTLASKRREATSAKTAIGIEQEWIGDEEHYQGYDDANRHEFVNTATKPLAQGGTEKQNLVPTHGSTVFPNITQPYCDAAAARVGDMLLPTDDRNFAIEATPIPDMFEGIEAAMAKAPAAAPIPPPSQQAQSMGVPGMPGGAGAGMPQQPPAAPEPQVQIGGVVMALSEAKARFDRMKTEAARRAERAQTQVDDWLQECQYHSEMRKVIDDAARLGSGVIKGPVPVKRVSSQWRRNEQTSTFEYIRIEEIKPASRRVDPWDLFPDPACGESIHNGAYIFERDRLTRKQLEALIGVPGYDEATIRQCLREGPMRQVEADARNLISVAYSGTNQFEIWYYHGDLTVEELEAAGCDCDGKDPSMSLPALCTMVNDKMIKAALNPLDEGQFPYDVIPWKRRPGMPWGMGVARQMRTPQRIVTAATRNLMDNAGLAAGPLIILRRGVEPEDGVMEIRPLKIFIEDVDADPSGASSPLDSVVIPMLQDQLLPIIQFGMKMAEDVTGLPMLLQGQQGTAPDTVGGLTILNNNANSVLRRIARLFDSSITEPHIRRYYAWLMEYGKDDDMKGDHQVIARGSTALVERDIQSQEMVQVVQLCLNPAYGKNPAKAMDEFLKSRRFDPAAFDYTDEEKESMKSQQPPEDPRVTAAKIAADATMQRDQQKFQFEAGQSERDQAFQKAMAELNAELAVHEQQGKREMSMEDLKTLLATTAMKLQMQDKLSSRAASIQAATPPTEPAGRAPAGHAYEA